MKYAFFLATGALLAAAMPLDKRALEIDWVTDIVTVTVTVDPTAPTSAAGGVFIQDVSSQPAVAPTPAPAPAPAPQAPAPKPVFAAPPPPVSSPKPAPPPPSPAPAAPTPVIVPVAQAPKSSPPPAASPEVAAKPSPKPAPAPSPSPKPAAASPAASSSGSSSSSGATDYQSAMLNEHNIHRANHSAPALEWDDQLAGFAHITASTCVFAHDM